jgi:hypothetical protein
VKKVPREPQEFRVHKVLWATLDFRDHKDHKANQDHKVYKEYLEDQA